MSDAPHSTLDAFRLPQLQAASLSNRDFPFYADDNRFAAIETAWASSPAQTDPLVVLSLAWQLRQRDPLRALQLIQGIEPLLDTNAASARNDAERLKARCLLIRAESSWLDAHLERAQQFTHQAMDAFTRVGDPIGCADAHWLLGMLAIDRGDWHAKDVELEAMAAVLAAADPVRSQAALAARAYFAAFRDRAAAQARWGPALLAGERGMDPAAGCWAEDFLAVCARHGNDFVAAVRHFIAAYNLALSTGQPRRAIVAATNAGDALNHLNDYQGALEWMERGLALARRTAWPGSMGVALLQTAHTLRLLDRNEASRDMLREALTHMAPLAGSRNHAYALWQLSEVELATGDHAAALNSSLALAKRADALNQIDLQSSARSCQARALLGLARPLEALEVARQALHLAAGAANLQIMALQVMADLHAMHHLPEPSELQAPSASLHYLERALALAAGIEGLTVSGDLLDAAAREHARLGDFRMAYDFSQRASQSRQLSYSQEASNRAIAMQVSHETERARAEAEHQRGLTMAQAERLDTLERIGAAGKEITSSLEPAAIFAALDQHSRSLLDAASLAIYRVVEGGSDLELSFGVRAGKPAAPHRIPANHPDSAVARCAREERATLTRVPMAVAQGPQSARPTEWVSLMCAPLKPGGKLLGVMSVESAAPRSYADRDAAIFRSLCAYAAIALANADVQALLVQKNQQLQELSISDRLTGLFNRLRLDEVLQAERARHARTGAELAVVLIDLDDFKSVNDTHGHQVGDEVLVRVASLLQTASRQLDVVGRWGGEEFLVVCRDTDLAGAAVLAEKLRGLLEQQKRPAPLSDHGTASFGVASLREGEEVAHLLARADAALYRAKRGGRNRVELQSA